jgi:hypothetical protein
MAEYAIMDNVEVISLGDRAVLLSFPEDVTDTGIDKEMHVSLSLIEDVKVLEDDSLDDEGKTSVAIKKWFLKKNDIDYEGCDEC